MGGLLCSRLALHHHKEEAHYGKQSGHHEDYKHMWTRGKIKVSFGTWRIFKNLEETHQSSINCQFLISAPSMPIEDKSWKYGNHSWVLILTSLSPSLYHFELFVVLSASQQFNYNEVCDLPLPIFLITSAGWPPNRLLNIQTGMTLGPDQ